MRSVLRAAKTACLFIGSVIGAGFATGREIAVFFGGGSIWDLVVSAAFMALCAYLFLEMGASDPPSPRIKAALDYIVAACSFVVYAAMIASAESVIAGDLGLKGASLLLALLSAALCLRSIAPVARFNALAVPVLIAVVVFVGAGTPFSAGEGAFHPIRSAAYGAMNMVFAGALMVKEGRALRKKERILASAISGGLILLALVFMFRAVGSAPYPEMPFLGAAEGAGLGWVAPALLITAIMTTMVGCNYLVADRLNAALKDPVLSLSAVTLFGYLFSLAGFSFIVKNAYPVISYMGLALTLLSPLYFLVFRAPKGKT